MATRPGPGAGPPSRPDATLQEAAAMVFVADPAAPLLTPDDAHHLLDVLRLRPGELVAVGDGSGSWSPCRVAPVRPGRASRRADPAEVVTVDGPVAREPRATPEITVAFAPTKGDRPEWVVQKLTELGVDRIVPVQAARSVVRWDGERGPRAVVRLTRVAREAAAQARRAWLPEIAQVTTLDELASSGLTLRLAQP
ncbi:MAG TPA: RsmE family RNA methyltransferase, partial [Acidimicrobiales bacterium]